MEKNKTVIIVIVILLAGFLLYQSGFFKSLGLFASWEEPSCTVGEIKCCSSSNIFCLDGSGTIKMSCESFQGGGGVWVGHGSDPSCSSVNQSCTPGQTKCFGKNSYSCSSGKWKFEGLVSGKCGYGPECTNGQEKCQGQENLLCIDQQWVNQGLINGKCGYNQGEGGCTNGQEKCIGFNSQKCENNIWVDKGKVKGKCSVSCLINSDCSSGKECLNYACFTPNQNECSTDTDCKSIYNSCLMKCSSGHCTQTIAPAKPCDKAVWMSYPDCYWDSGYCNEPECTSSSDCLTGWYCDEPSGSCTNCPPVYSMFSIYDCHSSSNMSCYINQDCYDKSSNWCRKWSCVKNICLQSNESRYPGCCLNDLDCSTGYCNNQTCISNVTITGGTTNNTVVVPAEPTPSAKKSSSIPGLIITIIVFGGIITLIILAIKNKWFEFK